VLVLAHGYPWSDGSQSDGELLDYAETVMHRWTEFADSHQAVIIVPVFGGSEFPDYRDMRGTTIDPAAFVDRLVDAACVNLARSASRFSLHGHSAGAQFAARYLVTHPRRLEQVVLGAPSTYPFPEPTVPWPYGMGQGIDDADVRQAAPDPSGWLMAATEVPVSCLVGDRDSEPRAPAPAQPGSTRLERAVGWVEAMRGVASARERACTVTLVVAAGLDHDEFAMANPAQDLISRGWGAASQS
jgi:pimeloyl-ACP methyl ester carboxylesterase